MVPSAGSGLGSGTGAGAGQDFVLFDDSIASNATQTLDAGPTSAFADPSSSLMGALQNTNAFTQYRNGSQPGTGARSIGSNESPFSSPASKPEDDLSAALMPGLATIGPSQIPPSGTLSKGTPKSKRARGHGYSSSWNGGNLQQHLHQLQQNSSPPFPSMLQQQQQQQQQQQMGSVPMAANNSFGGFSAAAGSGSDWSGSDTSPRNPPSGTFGPPIHSLSLADGSPDLGAMGHDQLASLFPATSAQMSQALAAASTNPMPGGAGGSIGTMNAPANTQQQLQEDRARQQIRADLMGVDSRALKGQLRNIQQGGVPMAFPSYDGEDQGQANNLLFPFVPSVSLFGQDAGTVGQSPTDGRVAAMHQIQRGAGMPAQPTRQFSDRTQQAVDRARAQVPTRKRFVRENSEQTVSPQQAFLDYDSIDAMLQQAQTGSGSMASNNSLFASMPSTTTATMDMAKAQASQQQQQQQNQLLNGDGTIAARFSGVETPRAVTDAPLFAPAHEGTPSLVDGGSSTSSNSRATSSVPSPPQRLPLNRGETVRPSRQQQERDSASQPSSQSSLFSRTDLGLLSPTDSTTSSTEDDEDEKPYRTLGGDDPRTSASAHGPKAGQRGAYGSGPTTGWGPRFSVVSSSSSESEDDFSPQQKGHANAALSSSQHSSYSGGAQRAAAPPSQQQALLGNAGQAGPANIAALLAGSMSKSGQQQAFMPPPLDTSGPQMMSIPTQQSSGDAPSESGSQQSQDDSIRKSPVIRSSAQAIYPFVGAPPFPASHHQPIIPLQQQQAAAALAANMANTFGGMGATPRQMLSMAPPPQQQQVHQQHLRPAQATAQKSNNTNTEDESEEDWDDSEEESDEYEDDDGDDDRRTTQKSRASTRGGGRARTSRGGANVGTRANRRRSHSGAGGHTGVTAAAAANVNASGLTVCDYVSPLTGEECGTEFHRPYDLARHRETIHAREEATLLRQGDITKEQCVVLYKEVDPARSMATVEWRCDGSNGCGALFSRKDALLRHRRIRNH